MSSARTSVQAQRTVWQCKITSVALCATNRRIIKSVIAVKYQVIDSIFFGGCWGGWVWASWRNTWQAGTIHCYPSLRGHVSLISILLRDSTTAELVMNTVHCNVHVKQRCYLEWASVDNGKNRTDALLRCTFRVSSCSDSRTVITVSLSLNTPFYPRC